MVKKNTTEHTVVTATAEELRKVFQDGVRYIDQYFFFENPVMAKVVVLWAMATWFLQSFDSFGYLAIWATLKRCGKSRLGESVSFMSRNYQLCTDVTPAALYATIDQAGADGCALMMDEAEKLNNESHPLREMLNVGCYRGIGVMRSRVIDGNRVSDRFEVFGGKIFVLIGNVFDTLRDRSISVEMSRMIGQSKKVYLRMIAKTEGEEIAKRINPLVSKFQTNDGQGIVRDTMMSVMMNTTTIDSRDLEMWCPVLTMATLIDDPKTLSEVLKSAESLTYEKTAPAKSHHSLRDREEQQLIADFAEKALKDLAEIAKTRKNIPVAEIVTLITEKNPLWLKFRGTGVTSADLGAMLQLHGVIDKATRREKTNGRKNQQTPGTDKGNVYKAFDSKAIIAAYRKIEAR